jgi:hypothetical protein
MEISRRFSGEEYFEIAPGQSTDVDAGAILGVEVVRKPSVASENARL